jgi:ketosteroid isomerase-like protein
MPDADVLRSWHAAWSDGDLDRVLALSDPDIVARPIHGILFSRPEYRGHEGIRQWFGEMTGPWDEYDVNVLEVVERDDEVVGILEMVAHRGEEELTLRVASVCRVRDGRMLSVIARDVWDFEDERRERGELS